MINFEQRLTEEQRGVIEYAITTMKIDPKPTVNEFCNYLFKKVDDMMPRDAPSQLE